jgi:hypothetical protein
MIILGYRNGLLTLDLLGSRSQKVVSLSLVWGTGPVPKESPLESLAALQLIREAKLVLLIGHLQEVKDLSRGFVDWEWRALVVVNQDRNAAVGVEPQEPYLKR